MGALLGGVGLLQFLHDRSALIGPVISIFAKVFIGQKAEVPGDGSGLDVELTHDMKEFLADGLATTGWINTNEAPSTGRSSEVRLRDYGATLK